VLKQAYKSSRLILIYVLTIVISGSILTWLSLNSISNFRELTEKRILEEEQVIVNKYAEEFAAVLDSLSAMYDDYLIKMNSIASYDLMNEKNLLFTNCFIINQKGDYLNPLYPIHTPEFNTIPNNTSLEKAIQKAELLEFADTDLKSARMQYMNALRFSRTPSDSAYVYNGIARILNKEGKAEEATLKYSEIITNFGSTTNDFGFSYANIAMSQILKSTDSIEDHVLEAIKLYVLDLNNNKILISNNTKSILKAIHEFFKDVEALEIQEVKSVLGDIELVLKNLERFDPFVQEFIQNNQERNPGADGAFNLVNPADSIKSFMLIKRLDNLTYAFVTGLDTIDHIIKNKDISNGNRFSYQTQLIAEKSMSGNTNTFVIEREFSPFFKEKKLRVGIKDMAKVDHYLYKRKLTTVSGLILLLAAMIIGLYTMVKDVYRKREIEKLRTDFVSNVTHELKTPLTSINMFAESILLDRARSDKQIKKYANVIVKESEKLKRSINNILEFSRNENKKISYNFKKIDLVFLVRKVLEEMNYWLELNKFEVHFEYEENCIVKGDNEALKQVFSNLISNAIKYSSDSKRLDIKIHKNSNKVIAEVKDSGIGIPKEKQQYIFDKFYRVKGNENSYISGTGLGLKVSKDIVTLHGGKIYVESKLNKGTKFTIELKS
jgi:signal transduction histidine kinase